VCEEHAILRTALSTTELQEMAAMACCLLQQQLAAEVAEVAARASLSHVGDAVLLLGHFP